MPPIGLILGGVNFSELKFVIQKASLDGVAEVAPEPEASTEEKLLSEMRDIRKESSTAIKPNATAAKN